MMNFILLLICLKSQVLIDHYRTGAAATGNNLLTGLQAYWTFDEASGDAADSSGNGRTLTENGTIDAGDIQKVTASRLHRSSVNDEYFSIASAAWNTFDTNDFTVAFWFAPSNTADPAEDYLLVGKTDFAAGVSWFLDFDAGFLYPHGKAFALYVSEDGNAINELLNVPLTTDIENGSWYFVVVKREGTTWTLLYAHESELAITSTDTETTAADFALFDNSTVPFTVGSMLSFGSVHTSQDTDGYIDELGVWNVAKSDCEINKLFNLGNGRAFSTFDANPCQ